MKRKDFLDAGYKQHPAGRDSSAEALLQRRVESDWRTLYFINVYEYLWDGRAAFEGNVSCATDSGGYAWLKFKEDTIEAIEARAASLWAAAGSIPYDGEVSE